MGDTAIEMALSIRAEHAEGPLWDAATGRLWWVDITGQRVHCFNPSRGQGQLLDHLRPCRCK
jgi:sugar lactone lactonase YvrE